MRENKAKICKMLLPVLQQTRGLSDLTDLEYERDSHREIVRATFDNGFSKEINVHLDSGTAMIRDIMRHIE